MLGWIRGEKLADWSNGNRQGILLNCNDLGYEIQMLPRELSVIIPSEKIILWIHQIQRDDGTSLFGFFYREERDLFRTLIAVNGVGSQMGICLLEIFKAEEFVEAIINQKASRLCDAQGVGKRTAERLIVELRNKLFHLERPSKSIEKTHKEKPNQTNGNEKTRKEICSLLKSLGYNDVEIKAAIKAVNEKKHWDFSKTIPITEDFDAFMTACLKWLSQEVA